MIDKELRCYFRVDASTTIGIGHFMRCYALAEYWRELGLNVTFIGKFPRSLEAILDARMIATSRLRGVHPNSNDLVETISTIAEGSVVVLDGYHFDERYQKALAKCHRLLVIDDSGGETRYAGFALLNQNLGATEITYRKAPSLRLLGPRYALLRQDFRSRSEFERTHPDSASRILLNLGGGDADNISLRVLGILRKLDILDIELRILVGPANPHAASLNAVADTMPRVKVMERSPDVGEEMQWAHMAITAAGTTCWELAVMGLPSVLIVVADNQQPASRALDACGAAILGGSSRDFDPDSLATTIRRLIQSRGLRESISRRGRQLVDGRGVERVTQVLFDSR